MIVYYLLIGSLLCNRNSRIPSHSHRPSSCRRFRRQSSLRRRITGVSRSSTWPRCSWMRCSSSWRSRPFAGSPSLGLQISWFCFARSFANFALIVTVTYACTLRCRSPRWLPSWRCPRMNSARTCSASSTRWRTSYGWRALRVWMESYSRDQRSLSFVSTLESSSADHVASSIGGFLHRRWHDPHRRHQGGATLRRLLHPTDPQVWGDQPLPEDSEALIPARLVRMRKPTSRCVYLLYQWKQ